ncbi:MAG TPA: DUF1028 domain-containing protein [Stellaceae bacterium]|nr:DUF1028 domain-containing protein [Stellaceae bacterium]
MTWSIIARDAETGAFGVAVTTKFLAVGALCPHAAGGVGALATQALVNPTFGPYGLGLLAEGKPATAVVDTLIAGDAGREARQLHVIDAQGGIAAYTGAECVSWCGHRIGDSFSVAGNMLAGAAVIDDTAAAYRAGASMAFAERLIAALEAGQRAGGDKRGKQSAALIIYSGEVYPYLDLRVDDHLEPLIELRRLYEEARRYYLPFLQFLPSRASPAGVYDRRVIETEIKRLQAAQNG